MNLRRVPGCNRLIQLRARQQSTAAGANAKPQKRRRRSLLHRTRWFLAIAAAVPVGLYLTRPRESEQVKPWQVAAYSALPLKALSRTWGHFNEIVLPVWMREPGFKLYSHVFGVNLDEVKEKDLKKFRNLSEFFYRELEDGARPVSDALLVSPSDGQVLQIGRLVDDRIEQVKGITYSLDAFLGLPREAPHRLKSKADFDHPGERTVERHEEFARLNGISYTVDDIVGDSKEHNETKTMGDAAVSGAPLSQMAHTDMWLPDLTSGDKQLFFAVIYLAPGDYHRFHSPANWVAQVRRHYPGELFSVAPYFQSKLTNLFCLNERVALLGRWKYGFFSMTPVGATNVGSIQINFDRFLRTNTRYIDTEDGEKLKAKKHATCFEATYESASPLLRGHPLERGAEMGGFHLGSTVVLVFEAPKTFEFLVKVGEHVKMGQPLGELA